MKSQVQLIGGYTGVAVGILKDVNSYLGTNSLEAGRDNDQLLSLIENRGLGFLTLTLPAVGKIFDRALSTGRLPLIAEPGFGRASKRSILPRFLGSIWMRIFDSDGYVLADPCNIAVACLRQIFYCFKKARLTCDPERITSVLDDFKRVDKALPGPDLDWSDPVGIYDVAGVYVHLTDVRRYHSDCESIVDGDKPIHDSLGSEVDLDVLQLVCDVVSSSFGTFCPEEWSPKHGRGAVADGRLGKDHKWSFPTWSARLESIFPMSAFGFPNASTWLDSIRSGDLRFEDCEVPGKLITVPKDMRGPRLIAAEPIANQYCQQAILAYLVRMVHSGLLAPNINFEDQGISRTMALEASHTDGYATIDLSHASDSVSCWLVERIFRSNKTLLAALMASRTSSVILPDGEHFNLLKFSTMGAATTFPVQSIFYACVCIAAEILEEGVTDSREVVHRLSTRRWHSRVFGDDLIVPKSAAKRVVKILTDLNFSVNPTKTFLEGNFKESCGMDAYRGVDVTPTYALELFDSSRPSTLASVLASANNLHSAGWWTAADVLESTVTGGILKQVPFVAASSGSQGRISYSGASYDHLKKRWNKGLQRREYRVLDVITSSRRHPTDGSASLLQYFMEAPDPTLEGLWSSDIDSAEPPSIWMVGYDERPGLLVQARWVVME